MAGRAHPLGRENPIMPLRPTALDQETLQAWTPRLEPCCPLALLAQTLPSSGNPGCPDGIEPAEKDVMCPSQQVGKVACKMNAEMLEQRFSDRMNRSLQAELAKLDQSVLAAAGPTMERAINDGAVELTAAESLRNFNQLRLRYERLHGAPWRAHEIRQKLTGFYARMCPTKLQNVESVVRRFEARGCTAQALSDLNSELLSKYGYDLDSFFHVRERHAEEKAAMATGNSKCAQSDSTRSNVDSPIKDLHKRLAMLTDETQVASHDAIETKFELTQRHGHAVVGNSLQGSMAARVPNHRDQPESHAVVSTLHSGPALQFPIQNTHISSVSTNDCVEVGDKPSVGASSPRWAGNASAVARAKFSYTAQQADELPFEAGDVITITGQSQDGWYWGYANGRKGLLPYNFVDILPAPASKPEQQRWQVELGKS